MLSVILSMLVQYNSKTVLVVYKDQLDVYIGPVIKDLKDNLMNAIRRITVECDALNGLMFNAGLLTSISWPDASVIF